MASQVWFSLQMQKGMDLATSHYVGGPWNEGRSTKISVTQQVSFKT